MSARERPELVVIPDGLSTAETIRAAQRLMRAEHITCTCGQPDCATSDKPFWDAVGDWLIGSALAAEVSNQPKAHALAVARAYLGGES